MSASSSALSSSFPNYATPNPHNGTKAVLSAFGLHEHRVAFGKALRTTGAFISGGSALYWYLNNVAETPIPVPEGSDMDIWLPVCPSEGEVGSYKLMYVSLAYFEALLTPWGYKPQSADERFAEFVKRRLLEDKGEVSDEIRYHRSPSLRFIKSIHNFINTDLNRKIQIIVTEARPGIRSEILRSFDFDICSFYVDSNSDGAAFYVNCDHTEPPPRLVGKPITNTFHLGDAKKFNFTNVLSRLEKYYGRGFVLEVEKPACTACGCNCKAGPTKLTLEEAKAYVKAKMEEHLPKKTAVVAAVSATAAAAAVKKVVAKALVDYQ